jgi:hypothetical protein
MNVKFKALRMSPPLTSIDDPPSPGEVGNDVSPVMLGSHA